MFHSYKVRKNIIVCISSKHEFATLMNYYNVVGVVKLGPLWKGKMKIPFDPPLYLSFKLIHMTNTKVDQKVSSFFHFRRS